MFHITKFEVENKRDLLRLPVYPGTGDEDYLHNYKDSDIGACISMLGMDAMLGNTVIRIGDSQTAAAITVTGETGPEGLKALKQYAEDFLSIVSEALPEMTKEYREFYQFMLDDYRKNGLVMPVHGRL